jgi:hypothetical protein
VIVSRADRLELQPSGHGRRHESIGPTPLDSGSQLSLVVASPAVAEGVGRDPAREICFAIADADRGEFEISRNDLWTVAVLVGPVAYLTPYVVSPAVPGATSREGAGHCGGQRYRIVFAVEGLWTT